MVRKSFDSTGWEWKVYSMFVCFLCFPCVFSASSLNETEHGKPSRPEGHDIEKRRPHDSDR